MSKFSNIPVDLQKVERLPENISIIIGENGSGKSTLLNDLSKHFIRNGENVIAIANSIHDKFDDSARNFKALRGRSGRRQTRGILKKTLESISEGDILKDLKSASRVLTYVNFDPVIGFRVERISSAYYSRIENADISENDKGQLKYLIERIKREYKEDEIIWFEPNESHFSEIRKSSLVELFPWENTLKKLRVIERIEVFLRKKGNVISMLDASSGELALITSIVYLSAVIDEKTVVLIDEPENSLHPKWQKEYIQMIFDIFYYYQPKIIVATHSPLIVNGAELFTNNPRIYKSQNFELELQNKEPLNMEETYYRFFNIATPQNRFLSEQIVRLLNVLSAKKISLNSFNEEIDRISLKVYDPKQKEVLMTVKTLASQIS